MDSPADSKVVVMSARVPSFLLSQGNRQGLDMGTEYRSIILCEDEEQLEAARASKEAKQVRVTVRPFRHIN